MVLKPRLIIQGTPLRIPGSMSTPGMTSSICAITRIAEAHGSEIFIWFQRVIIRREPPRSPRPAPQFAAPPNTISSPAARRFAPRRGRPRRAPHRDPGQQGRPDTRAPSRRPTDLLGRRKRSDKCGLPLDPLLCLRGVDGGWPLCRSICKSENGRCYINVWCKFCDA